ncbi:MAG: hypothetical protein AB1635_21345, partial [Acidobacteriota bacterium]
MLRLYRRHRVSCPHTSERFRRCACPIYVEGSLAGEPVRKSLDLTSWKAASDLIARWNASGEIGTARTEIPDLREAVTKFISDAEARNLEAESVKKIRDAVERTFLGYCERKGFRVFRRLDVDAIREFRNELARDYAPTSARGRLGYVRAFLRFAAESGWIKTNPALAVKAPWRRRSETRPVRRSESDPPEGRSFYAVCSLRARPGPWPGGVIG